VKRCKICGEFKPFIEFHRATGMRDGHRNECKPCYRAINNARNAREPEKHRARVKRWQLVNRERYLAKQREYVESGRKALTNRRSHLKRKYGISLEDYEVMLDAQGGVCKICGEPRPEERTLHVDHDHETGAIRGLLCFRCNNAIGDLRDDHDLARKLADYLDQDDKLAALARARVKALRS
jgi:hypothetical protein